MRVSLPSLESQLGEKGHGRHRYWGKLSYTFATWFGSMLCSFVDLIYYLTNDEFVTKVILASPDGYYHAQLHAWRSVITC